MRKPYSIMYKNGQAAAFEKLGLIGTNVVRPMIESLNRGFDSGGLSDPALYQEIEKQIAEQNIPLKVNPRAEGPYYHPGQPQTNKTAPVSEHIGMAPRHHTAQYSDMLAHELGHKHLQNKKYLKYLQHHRPYNLARLSPYSGFIAGAIPYEEGERNLGIDAAALALPAAPQLGAEGYATLKGLKLLHGAGASGAQLRHAGKNLARGFGTYALNSLGAGAINYGVGRMLSPHLSEISE